MWRIIPINISNGILFDRFDAIIKIARTMKGCHTFYLSKEDSKIYGCNEQFYCIHAIDIVQDILPIPASIVFKILCIDEAMVELYKSFIWYPEAPWMMLPTATVANHNVCYNPVFDTAQGKWVMLNHDGTTVDFLNLYGIDTDMGVMGIHVDNIITMVNNMKALEPYLGERQFFGDKDKDPLIQEVFTNKASEGCRYMRLTGINGKNYGFMLFKNLFNMNKADNLTIIIRDRLDNPALYQATFITTKKKSPIPDVLPQHIERTHVMFMNI